MIEKEKFEEVIGQEKVKLQIKSALLSNRHILIVGPPGIGKTTLAKNIAKVLPEIEIIKGCKYNCDPKNPSCIECKEKENPEIIKVKGTDRFVRVQGSPDLTVEDLLGDIDPIKALKYGPLSLEAFTPGKIFKANKGILFFDEINRCPEKIQNSLLQVLQEKKTTLGSYDVDFDIDIILIATMNPEDVNTEPMSDVLLDRFDVVYMSYPTKIEYEIEIVNKYAKVKAEIDDKLKQFMVYFVRLLRESKDLEKKPSVRASIGLIERATANAHIFSRKTTLQDFKDVMVSVLAHRIKLKPSVKFIKTPQQVLEETFKEIIDTKEGKEFEEGDLP